MMRNARAAAKRPAAEAPERRLVMQFAGGLVKHLGLQMYAGAVPAIAELVANAWDADATKVWVDLPLNQPITEESKIVVRDNGNGMTFEDIRDLYLVVGRDRRANEGNYTLGGRRAMGRKGIGKLAGFGIAQLVQVYTVKEGLFTGFQMDYEKITRHGSAQLVEPYYPEVLADRPVREGDPAEPGTAVVLRRLQVRRAINGEQFRRTMLRRFAVLSSTFEVVLNGEPVRAEDMKFEFRFPPEGKTVEEIPGAGQVRWWIGFTPETIKAEEARGVSVLAHGKLAQAPFDFHLTGGVQGQHGLQYLTGEVEADYLDEELDLIATDRSSVRWEDQRALELLAWGQRKLRELLKAWSDGRQEKNLKKLRDTTPYLDRIEKFPARERRELSVAINRLASIETIDDARLRELVELLVKAYENEHFMGLIRALNAADDRAQEEIFRLVEEWDVLEAVATAGVVRGRVEIIRKFRGLIESKAPEKPVMQDFLKDHPWLVDPSWQVLRHEGALDTVVADHFGLEPTEEAQGGRRLDFFCLADTQRTVVVEVKRPGDLVGRDEIRQLEDYVDFLRRWVEQTTDPRFSRQVEGVLIFGRFREDVGDLVTRAQVGRIYVRTWENLLYTAESLHRDFLEVVKSRAPADDPRIQNLPPSTGEES